MHDDMQISLAYNLCRVRRPALLRLPTAMTELPLRIQKLKKTKIRGTEWKSKTQLFVCVEKKLHLCSILFVCSEIEAGSKPKKS